MAKLIDLTGQRFDKLIVLKKAPTQKRHTRWICQCDCGNIINISGESLRRDIPHDCGCVKQLIKQQKIQEKQEKENYLIGQKFGYLTVIERTKERNNGSIVWKCQCKCGNIKKVPTHLLTSGHTKSCGCLVREVQGKDISNQRFGKLIALYPCNEKKRGTIIWHCKCDCGNECNIDGALLRNGSTQSCGCINSSVGENHIEEQLLKNNMLYKKEYCFSDLYKIKNKPYRFDFAILDSNNKVIRLIEFDGIQHYSERTGIWNNEETLEERQKRDQEKNQYAKEHNIPLVRIPYWERDNITLDMILGDQYLI